MVLGQLDDNLGEKIKPEFVFQHLGEDTGLAKKFIWGFPSDVMKNPSTCFGQSYLLEEIKI